MENTAKFFLGANSDSGFMSYFKQLQEANSVQLLILKGGPGSGKSTLMKRVADYAATQKHTIEEVPCASDPSSLDAVIDKTASFAVIDGTAPHTEDPILPGVTGHIMYTGDLWDTEKLRLKKKEIEFFSDVTSGYHRAAGAYIKSAGTLLRENLSHSETYVSPDAEKLVLEIMKELPDGAGYREEKRLLSAVTTGEIRFFEDTLRVLSDEIYVIEDDFGGAAEKLFQAIKRIAHIKGMSFIACPCSIMPDKTDHIIFPEARVAFTKGNRFFSCNYGKKINSEDFYLSGIDRTLCDKRIQDAKKLLTKASSLVKSAKKSHDTLEKYYASAMNFERSDELFEKIKRMFYK